MVAESMTQGGPDNPVVVPDVTPPQSRLEESPEDTRLIMQSSENQSALKPIDTPPSD